jgi:hypothetical protein
LGLVTGNVRVVLVCSQKVYTETGISVAGVSPKDRIEIILDFYSCFLNVGGRPYKGACTKYVRIKVEEGQAFALRRTMEG